MNKDQRAQREKQMKRLLDQGVKPRDIASRFGITTQAVYKYIKQKGWKIPSSVDN